MAAEKSKDAYIPVCLALTKLGFLFLLEYLGQVLTFNSTLNDLSLFV